MYPGRCPGLGASALSGRAGNRASALSGRAGNRVSALSGRAGLCLNHTDFLDLIQCLLDIIQDILHILDTY